MKSVCVQKACGSFTNECPQMRIGDKRDKKTMHKKMMAVAICVSVFAINAATRVTGSRTSGTVPVFTGTSTVGNSPIEVLGSNVGIYTANSVTPKGL